MTAQEITDEYQTINDEDENLKPNKDGQIDMFQ